MLSSTWLWLHLSLMYHKPMSPALEVRTNSIPSFSVLPWSLAVMIWAHSCDYVAGLLPTAAGDTGSLLQLVFAFGFSPGRDVTFLILRLVKICRLLCRHILWHATKSILSALPSENKTNQWESFLVKNCLTPAAVLGSMQRAFHTRRLYSKEMAPRIVTW